MDPIHARTKKSHALAAVVTLTAIAATGEAQQSLQPPSQVKQQATASYGKLPLHFEANQGQMDGQVEFLARGSGYGLFLTATESVLVLRKPEADGAGKASRLPAVLRQKLLGANPRPALEGREQLPGKSHYFIGNDPKKWQTDVPHYARVNYKDVYPGVSLTYYGNQGRLEYDFVVDPGADPRLIRLGIEGADEIRVDANGNLVLSLPDGEVVESAPVVYQEAGGARKVIDGRFVLRGRREVGFEVGTYEADRPLVLDPVLVYSTYLGGSSTDQGLGIAVDASGNAYVTGLTTSLNFPTANPLQGSNGGGVDAFVAKLNAAGSALVYSTYLGGSDVDYGNGIAVDASGNAYVTGWTSSTDFPTANPLQGSNGGGVDAFVAKLNAAGSALGYSTYLGGSGDDGDIGNGIAVDASGNAYVTGLTGSTNFPTVNALQAASGGGQYDAFVAKLNAPGSALVYSTYLGGGSTEEGLGVAVDLSGNAYVTGWTASANFPTANPFQASNGSAPCGFCGSDAFLAKLNAAGSALVYSTYLGGSSYDGGVSIAVDASGNAYVTGDTVSTDFPTVDPLPGSAVAFVAKLNAGGSALAYSTYLGGSGGDRCLGIAVDPSGNAYVTGWTGSTDFPTVNPLQAANGGGIDGFVAKIRQIPLPADLSITKTDGQDSAVPGTPVTYTIVASNAGPNVANGATVADTLPAAIAGASWSCLGTGGGTCTGSGSGSINDTVNLPMGASVTYTLTGTINAAARGSLGNTATVTAPAALADPNLANNSATDTDVLPGVSYFTVAPCRVVDTRGGAPIGGPILQGQQTRVFPLGGLCGIPSSARAVSVNLAVTQSSVTGNLRLFPAGQAAPTVSSINYAAGQTRANNAIVSLDFSGQLAAFVGQTAGTTVHLIIDVNGYFE